MKKTIIIFSLIIMLFCCSFAASAKGPIYADRLNDGTYKIEVTSSSSMFRIVDCELTVADGEMTATVTLSSTSYEKLFLGTGDEALLADAENHIYFENPSAEKHTYIVPVEALDKEIDCAAFSIRKQKWYDRTLVFESSSLPKEAFAFRVNVVVILVSAVAVLAVIAVVIVLKKRRKH